MSALGDAGLFNVFQVSVALMRHGRHAEVCWVCTLRLRFLNQERFCKNCQRTHDGVDVFGMAHHLFFVKDTRCPLCNEELGEAALSLILTHLQDIAGQWKYME